MLVVAERPGAPILTRETPDPPQGVIAIGSTDLLARTALTSRTRGTLGKLTVCGLTSIGWMD